MNPASYQRAPPFLSDTDVDFTSPDPSTSSTAYSEFSLPTSSGSHPQTPFSASFTAQPGSYQNSPFGSDVSHFDQHPPASSSPNPAQNSPYVGQSSNDDFNFDIPVFPPDEYDPNDYDAQGSSLLFNTDFVTSLDSIEGQPSSHQLSSPSPSASSACSENPGISVIPAEQSMQSYGSPSYQGSPASSNAGDDFHLQSLQQRSRASSVASSHKASNSHDYSTLSMEHVHLDSSSPSWMQQGTSNAQSPPHIVIPDNSGARQGSPAMSSHAMSNMGHNPLRNPQLDLDGPGIQVVPATPISAGNGNAAHGGMGPFSHLMRQQGRSPPSIPSNLSMSHTSLWTQQQQQHQQQQQQQQLQQHLSESRRSSPVPGHQPYNIQSNNAILSPPSSAGNNMGGVSNDILGGLQLGLSGRGDSSKQMFGSVNDAQFLVPISNPRTRSKSETTMQRPSWQVGASLDVQQETSIPVTNQQDQHQHQQQQMQTPQLSHLSASFGPPVTDNTSSQFGNAGDLLTGPISSNNFLSPDHALTGIGAPDLRRARSEGHGHKRNALSADMTPIYADQSNMLYPSQAHFRFGGTGGNYLTAGGMGANVPSAAGAHRRTMSGGSGHGHHSRSLSRERVSLGTSPYPSPHASPRTNTQLPLPDPFGSGPSTYGSNSGSGMGPGSVPPTVHVMSHDAEGRPTVQSQQPVQVARQNVTTHATADASQRRRRTEANFACPVPGCGSTFTRHFNLKGHMRSHNEERPFKCKWPGCDKGFARQHDCKRHEQLHLNIRPYICQGCQRQFARMDALNRHLRSDAGTECQARQPILTSEDAHNSAAASNTSLSTKEENGNGGPWKSENGNGIDDEWRPLPQVNGVVV